MSDSVYLGLKARQLEDSPAYQPISCVRLTIGGEDSNGNPIVCQWPPDSVGAGRILETSNPLIWDVEIGNRVAHNIHDIVKGYAYKPYTAEGALINPVAEIGDAVEVGDVYSVIADVETTFSPLMSANISAPAGNDIDHEYPYESSESYAQRRTAAELGQLKTEFIVQNGEVSWAISQIGAVDQEGSIWNKLTSVQTTVDGITVRTESDVQTIVGSTRINWANINVTPEEIKTKVEEYFDASGAANTAYKDAKREAKEYTDGEIAAIEGDYKSEITQSAKEIMSTVASTETIWNVYSLSQTEQNKFAVYGYGRPSDENSPDNKTRPSDYNGKYYLDQSTGQYWRSNGRQWSPQGTIKEKLAVSQQSAITQNKNSITSVVEEIGTKDADGTILNRLSRIEQTPNDITLSVYSNQNGTTYFKLSDGSGEISSTSFNFATDIVNVAGNLTAKYIAAGVSITAPTLYSPDYSEYLTFGSNGRHYGLVLNNRRGDRVFSVYDGDFGIVSFSAKNYEYMRVNSENATQIVYAYGTWDFRNATVLLPSS